MVALMKRRWWALGALMLSLLTIGFDATILNVALDPLAAALHADTDDLQWIIDAYVLVFAGLLLPAGALADRYGRKTFLVVGLGLFGAASVVASLAGSAATVIAARCLMGVGAAVLTPTITAVVTRIFPADERPRAVAFMAIGLGAGVPLGPIVGGYLLRHFWWGSVFLVNVPVVAVALIAVAVLVPQSRDPRPRPVDLVGGLLSTGGLVLLVYAVIAAPAAGWTSARVLVAGPLGVLLLVAFLSWERRQRAPLIDLSLFGRPRFVWGSTAATVAAFAMFGLLFVVPLYLQAVRGHDALAAGVRLLPMMAGLMIGAKTGERVAARTGARLPMTAGLLLLAAGLAVGALTRAGSGYGFVAGWLAVAGAGVGLTTAPALDAVMGELPPERSGSGAALTLAMRQVGAALGVALLGSLSSVTFHRKEGVTRAMAEALANGDATLAAEIRDDYAGAMAAVLVACAAVCALGAAGTARWMRDAERPEEAVAAPR
ncbi:MFS transporter [Virgisporangium aliadipatigenens]|uniref:MFS transporter n=2 Tax=Virgisporangium aliadipatigenens TaxID=741659 RepID=A0A8J3YU64_9ACTN|nr:MFS transporter [Virgisporangium aliadipatigenens]